MLPRFPAAVLAASLLTILGFLLSASRADNPGNMVANGDRIIFLGDSITRAGGEGQGFIVLFKKALQDKARLDRVELVNAGVNGSRVADARERLANDVLARNPKYVIVSIGINDIRDGTSPDKFEAGLKEIVQKVVAKGARVILCTPTVIGEKKAGGNKLDTKLDQYADSCRKVADAAGAQVCDLRSTFKNYLRDGNPQDKEQGILTTDGIHLSARGNQLVADTIYAMFNAE